MMLIPAIPRQPAADLLAYAQEAVTIGHSLIAEGGRQDGDLRLPTLRHPPDGVERQTLLVTRANHETGRGTFDLSGPLASGPDRAQAKTRLPAPGSRQKAQKAPRRPWLQNRYQQLADHREQRSPIYHLPPYLPRSARGQGCPCNRQFCDGRHSAGRGPGNMLRGILTDRGLRDGQRS